MNDLSCTNTASYSDIMDDRNSKNTNIKLTDVKHCVACSKIECTCGFLPHNRARFLPSELESACQN